MLVSGYQGYAALAVDSSLLCQKGGSGRQFLNWGLIATNNGVGGGPLPETSDCMAAFMASFAFGLDHHDVACTVRTAAAELRAGHIGLADFYVRLARAPHFSAP